METLGSTIVGGMASAALGLFFISNPVGWGVALVLGTAASTGSYGEGKGLAWVYDTHYRKYELASMSGVDQLCR